MICLLFRKVKMLSRNVAVILSIALLTTMLLGAPVPSEVPLRWKINIETTAFDPRGRLFVSVEAFSQNDYELVVQHARSSDEKGDVIIAQKMQKPEAMKFWSAFAAMQSRFALTSKVSERMDGGFLHIELSIGTGALGMRYSRFANLAEIAPELVAPLAEIRRVTLEKMEKVK